MWLCFLSHVISILQSSFKTNKVPVGPIYDLFDFDYG